MSGSRMARKNGVLTLMTTTELRLDRKVIRKAVMVAGITWSIMSMSLEKRFVIRPMGVESKKCSGERSMLISISW